MRPSTRAWTALAAAAITYDILCPDGETLTAAARRHQPLTWIMCAILGAHLCADHRADPITAAAALLRRR